MNARSSSLNVSWTVICSRRSAIRRLSKRSWSSRDPSLYMAMRPRYARYAPGGDGLRGVDVDVDEQRGVVGRKLALAGEPVDESPPEAIDQRLGDVGEIDAHAAMLVEVTPAVVPVREQLVLWVHGAERVDEPPVAQP